MATPFCLSMGYIFGCMIASDTLFDSRGWVFGVKLSDKDIADFEVLRDVAIATTLRHSISAMSSSDSLILKTHPKIKHCAASYHTTEIIAY